MAVATESDGYSLSIASYEIERAVVFGLARKIFVAFFGDAGEHVLVVDDEQVVRSVAFLQPPGGGLCVVAGGDGKLIHVYSIPSRGGGLREPLQESEAHSEGPKLLFRFGPHTKRITHVATCGESTILFADKFGEVFRLELTWAPDSSLESNGSDAVPSFLLQHLSVMSAFFLSAPNHQHGCAHSLPCIGMEKGVTKPLESRRFFTFDKERHARVSCYPDTFHIEQFLWTESPQSVVTSITEISDPTGIGRYSYFVLGCRDGRVHLWAAENGVSTAGRRDPFTLLGSLSPDQVGVVGDADDIAVVSVVHVKPPTSVSKECTVKGRLGGVFIAYSTGSDVVFVPFHVCGCDNMLSFFETGTTRAHLESYPLAMTVLGTDSTLILLRSGSVRVLQLADTVEGIFVRMADVCCRKLEEAIASLTEGTANALLEEMDLFAQWNYDVVDPRRPKRSTRAESEHSEEGECVGEPRVKEEQSDCKKVCVEGARGGVA